jgi:hypothetical protein
LNYRRHKNVAGKGGARPGAGRKPHQPTDKNRGFVIGSVAAGTPQEFIARHLKISVDTMAAYYREELDAGGKLANAQVGLTLFKKATSPAVTGPSVTAAIWWEKTRVGMSEATIHRHTGADGGAIQVDLTGMSDDKLAALESLLSTIAGASLDPPESGPGGNGATRG